MKNVPWKPIAALAGVSAVVHGGDMLGILPDVHAAQFPCGNNYCEAVTYDQWGNGEDSFTNWDYSENRVDTEWPIDLIFRNNARYSDVKNAFKGYSDWHYVEGFPCNNVASLAIFPRNQPGDAFAEQRPNQWNWDDDTGLKGPYCVHSNDLPIQDHFRMYKEFYDESMYSPAWGFYLIGEAHRHYKEGECTNNPGSCGEWVGQEENAESNILSQAYYGLGWHSYYANCPHTYTYSDKNGTYTAGRDDCEYMSNSVYYSEYYPEVGGCAENWPYNNGYATHIWVP